MNQRGKKKIGVVTFWQSNDNYGQQLQHWALQQVLKRLGYKPFLIRYMYWLDPIGECSRWKRIKRYIKREILPYQDKSNRETIIRRKFPLFRAIHICQSFRVYRSFAELQQHPPKASIYIAGSDQIWNCDLRKEDLLVGFLSFGKKKVRRIAYAPSISHSYYPKDFLMLFDDALQKFDAVSVREKTAIHFCEGLGHKAIAALDPSMLLTERDYRRLFPSNKLGKESFFIYSINYDSVSCIPFEAIKNYANKQQIPIVVTTGSGYLPPVRLFDGVEYIDSTISQWLQTISCAKYVITASFHGIIFCILFHRPFLFTPLNGRYAESNVRVLDLLSQLNLEQCIWNGEEMIKFDYLINWESVDQKISILRKTSIDFLKHSLNEQSL